MKLAAFGPRGPGAGITPGRRASPGFGPDVGKGFFLGRYSVTLCLEQATTCFAKLSQLLVESRASQPAITEAGPVPSQILDEQSSRLGTISLSFALG